MKNRQILTSNISYTNSTIHNLIGNQERLIAAYAVPGSGKTIAGEYLQAKYKGIYCLGMDFRSKYAIASRLMRCLGFSVGLARSEEEAQYRLIQEIIKRDIKLIAIDEAHQLSGQCLEFMRSIHDATKAIVLLMGEPELYANLATHNCLLDRTTHVEFAPLEMMDAVRFCREIAEIEIAEDLIVRLHTFSDGNLRRFKNGVHYVERYCQSDGGNSIDSAEWGMKPFKDEIGQHPEFAKFGGKN